MIGDDDPPTTPPPSPHPPPIAPSPSPLGLGRRLLGSIRALSSAIALPSPTTPAASSSSSPRARRGLSLLLHLKPDLHLHDPPPPLPSSSHQDQDQDHEQAEDAAAPPSHQDQDQDQDHEQAEDAAAPPKAKRALLLPQPPTPSPSTCSSLAPSASAAVDHHQVQEEPCGLPLLDEAALNLHTQGAAAAADEPGPTKGLHVLEQHKGDTRVDLPVTKQGTLLSIQDHVAAGDGDNHHRHRHRDEQQQQQRTSVVDHHQLKVDAAIDDDQFKVPDATARQSPTDDAIAVAAQEQDYELATHGLGMGSTGNDDAVPVEGQEVVEQDVVDGVGQGTQDANAVDADDQEKKPLLEQCTSTSCEELLGTAMENDGAKDDQEEVEQGVIGQGDATIDDGNAVKGHEVVGQSVIDDAIVVADDQEKKPLEQCNTSCEELGTDMENDDDTVQVQEVVEQQDATQPRDEDIAAEDQLCKVGSTENADAVQVQEAVEQGLIGTDGESADATAVDDHDMAVEQCATYHDLGTTMGNGGAKDDQEEVEQGLIDQGDAAIDDVKDHEVLLLGAVEGTHATSDDIAVEDRGKNVEQCTTYDDLGTTMKNDDAVDDQQVVEQGVVDLTTMDDDASVKEQEVVEQGVVDLTTMDDDASVKEQEVVEQGVVDLTTMDDDASVKEQEVVEQGVVDLTTMDDDASVKEQEVVEQGVVDLTTMDDDASVKEQEVVEQGVVDLTMDDDSVKDHEVLQQGIIDGTDDIAVQKQEKVLEPCSRATKDEHTVKEKEMVVEQGVIDPKYMDLAMEDQDKLSIINDQGTVPMDDIVVQDHDKAVVQYASDAIGTIKDESPVEEHDTVGNQDVFDKNGRIKDGIDVEEHGYVKEQVIIDKWGTSSDATALEGQKNEAELCIGDEQIAGKDMDGVHAEGNMLEQRTGDKHGATLSDFTVDKHKDVVERDRHKWGAPEDDLAMDTTAYQGTRDWGIVNKEKVKLPEDDRAMDTAAYQGTGDWGIISKEKYRMPARRYPQKPRKLNCPSYMSKGTCTYGPSCHFNHPPQFNAKTNDSWRPSERRNHGAAEILELNRLGLPIREGARNCDYYMRTGACRYGKNCHFNHPDHVIDARFSSPTGWEDNVLQTEKSSDNALTETSHMKKSSYDATLNDRSHLKKSSDDATLDDRSHLKKSSDDATLDDRSHLKKSSDGATVDDTSYSKKSSYHDPSSTSGVLPPSIFRMLLPPQKVLPSTEGKAKKKSDWSSASDDSDGCCSADSSDGPLCKQEEHADYPERPGRQECPFLARYGDCKFASACKYHHPKQSKDKEQVNYPERRSVTTDDHHPSTRISPELLPQQPQYPERPGQPDCRYYMQFGKCKYLSACIFHHPKDRLAAMWNPSDLAHSDQIGPEIHGMPECSFYMKSGKCQFGSLCEFRHPKDIYSTTEEAFGERTGSGAYDSLTRSDNGVEQQEGSIMYPERPGEPECAHYMRQGYCKFQMNCKYHHPGDRLSKKPTTRLATELVRTDHLSKAGTRWLPHECYQRKALS